MNALIELIDGLYKFNIEKRGFDGAFDSDTATDDCLIRYMRNFWFPYFKCCEDYCSCLECKRDFYVMLKEGLENND